MPFVIFYQIPKRKGTVIFVFANPDAVGIPMDIFLRIFNIIIGVLVFSVVINMLIRQKLNEASSISWFLISLAVLISAIFPNLINGMAKLVRISYAPTLLFLISIFTIMFILFKHSVNISTMEGKINEMAVLISLLSEENKNLKEKISKNSSEEAELSAQKTDTDHVKKSDD